MTVLRLTFTFALCLFCFAGCTESSEPGAFNLEVAGDAGPDAPDAMEDNNDDQPQQGCAPE